MRLDICPNASLKEEKQACREGRRIKGWNFPPRTFDTYVCDEAVPAFEKNVAEAYTAKIGYASSLYVANIADGAHRL